MVAIRNKKGRRSTLFYLVWSAPIIGTSAVIGLLNYITFFATDVLGLNTALSRYTAVSFKDI